MSIIESTIAKIDAFLDRTAALLAADFPYPSSKEALQNISSFVQLQRSTLERVANHSSAVATPACKGALRELYIYLPVLGFTLRSKNINNPLEAYWPLLRVARKLIGDDVRLILSSEWEFSPYTYRPLPRLREFVLIGIPAPESDNALVLPLAGHELGHTLWVRSAAEAEFSSSLETILLRHIEARWEEFQHHFGGIKREELSTTMKGRHAWEPAHRWGLRQVEETFCDAVGLRIFDAAYLHAFAYLLAPGLPGGRVPSYPAMHDRVRRLLYASARWGIAAPEDYLSCFDKEEAMGLQPTQFLLSLTDEATEDLLEDIVHTVEEVAAERNLERLSRRAVGEIAAQFEQLTPCSTEYALVDIINAGWEALFNRSISPDYIQVAGSEKRIISELMFKSFEVTEYLVRTE